MIKYDTKDLVDRARQLADLENSSFIGWKENMMAMNSAFQKVYQKAINHDERFWMKEVYLGNPITQAGNETRYTLPDDFYQLYAINDAKTNRCLLRMSLNEPYGSLRYNIVNNELVIYGVPLGTIQVRYFPNPKTLVLAPDKVDVDFPDLTGLNMNEYCRDVYGSLFCYIYTDSNDMFHFVAYDMLKGQNIVDGIMKDTDGVTDLGKNTIYGFTNAYLSGVIAAKNGYMVFMKATRGGNQVNLVYFFYNYSLTAHGDMPALILNQDKEFLMLYTETYDETYYGLATTNGIKVKSLTQEQYDFLNFGGMYTETEYYFATINTNEDKLYFVHSSNLSEVLELDLTKPLNSPSNPSIYKQFLIPFKYLLKNGEYLLGYSPDVSTVIDIDSNKAVSSTAVGINKIDFDTGFGVTEYKTLTEGYISPVIRNTLLEYPNNFFYEMIAYELAIQYKSKQNADCAGLIALYNQAEEQFYDTITRDAFAPTRIQNVY